MKNTNNLTKLVHVSIKVSDIHNIKIIKKMNVNEQIYYVKLIIYMINPTLKNKLNIFFRIHNREEEENYHVYLVDFKEHYKECQNIHKYPSSIFNNNFFDKSEVICSICYNDKEDEEIEKDELLVRKIYHQNFICNICHFDLLFEEVSELLYNFKDSPNPIEKLQKDGYNISLTEEKEFIDNYKNEEEKVEKKEINENEEFKNFKEVCQKVFQI